MLKEYWISSSNLCEIFVVIIFALKLGQNEVIKVLWERKKHFRDEKIQNMYKESACLETRVQN